MQKKQNKQLSTPLVQSKKIPTLDNWNVTYLKATSLPSIHGNIYGHGTVPNGRSVTTSSIIRIDIDKMLVQTIRGNYKLGAINPEYERLYKGEI